MNIATWFQWIAEHDETLNDLLLNACSDAKDTFIRVVKDTGDSGIVLHILNTYSNLAIVKMCDHCMKKMVLVLTTTRP